MNYNRVCNLEDFADPHIRRTMRRVFPHEVVRFGDGYPQGFEYRKHWEVAMAIGSLEAAGALRTDAEVLGVGAGNEPTIFHLTSVVRRVFATDLYLADAGWDESANATMLNEPERHWPPDTPWNARHLVVQHMNALDLRYDDGTFDGVFSSSSIEHFGTLTDVHRALAEIHRVLKPGGVLSISTEHRLTGPAPGLPGILMFDAEDVSAVFLAPFDWVPLGPVEFEVSEATLETEQRLVDLSAEVSADVEERGFIEFHRLDWNRYPHVVLRHEDHRWTSMHLALRKPPRLRRRLRPLRKVHDDGDRDRQAT